MINVASTEDGRLVCLDPPARTDAEHERQRRGFTTEALAHADALWDGLVLIDSDGCECGHGDFYRLDPETPLPTWLHAALKDAVFTGPESDWPEFGRTDSPVDWPFLMRAHPEVLVMDSDAQESNGGPSWAGIEQAHVLLEVRGHAPMLDVSLAVTEDNRISLFPHGLLVTDPGQVPADLVGQVDDILVRHGRTLDDIQHYRCGNPTPACWVLTG